MLEPMVHGPHLQIDTFQRADQPAMQRQVLVRRHRGLGTDFVRRQTGAYHIDAVEPRLGCDLLLPAVEREAAIGNIEREVLLHLVLVDHGSDREPNHAGIMHCGLASHLIGNAGQPTFGRLQKLLALPRALLGQRRIAAGNEPLAGKVGRADLGQVAVVKQGCNGPVSAASAAICGALRQLIQSSPAGASSSVIRAEVIMPRSPTSATCDSLKRRLSLSICLRIVCGSLVLPSNTSTATGVPSGAHSNPYTICGRSGRRAWPARSSGPPC